MCGISIEPYLILITKILLECLNPNEVNLRKSSLKIVTVILGQMVKKYPMLSFHHDSQKLAVGTIYGPIAIYDIRTTAKQILNGHSGRISCLQFNKSGNYLVSYSNDPKDMSMRLWKIGSQGFFSGIIGITVKCAKMV